MIRTRRASALVLAVGATLALLTACVPDGSVENPQDGGAAAGGNVQPDPTEPPTCTSILPATLVAEFEGYGMTAIEEPFAFGDPQTTTVPDGIMCTWGTPDVATDHGVQMFGWAPLTGPESTKWVEYLLDEGWSRTDGEGLIYLSEPFRGVDGVTYAFGDGFVLLADTKQSIALVSRR